MYFSIEFELEDNYNSIAMSMNKTNIGKPVWTRKKSILLTSLLFVLVSISISGQKFELSNIQKIQNNGQYFLKPRWDKSSEKLLLTGEHNKGVYTLNIIQNKFDTISLKDKTGRNAFWTNKNEIAHIKKGKPQFFITNKSTRKEFTDTLAYIDIKSKQVYKLESKSGIRTKLTKIPGLYYLPMLSPDGQNVVYHLKSEIYIQSLSNENDPILVGSGIASSWHPNSQYIFFFKDFSIDGHQTSSSDLYYYSLQENKIYKLTETEDLLEMWPNISADGKKLAFSDEKTGTVYIAEIIEK